MSPIDSLKTNHHKIPSTDAEPSRKPLVSVIVPGYNEAAIIEKSLAVLHNYLVTNENRFDWELLVINDGSTDNTGELAENFASQHSNVRVLHHFVNYNLGQALRYAFNECRGDYVVTLDIDLSYAPEHIGNMFDAIVRQQAKIVIASPYMKGGKVANVPWLRKFLSINANRFLSMTAKGDLATLTGMVRIYDGTFLRNLSLKSMDVSIHAEILYKAMVLGARIVEIPGTLDWNPSNDPNFNRSSSMKIGRSIFAYLFSGFMFKPFIFFILPGLFFAVLSCYSTFWVFAHTIENLPLVHHLGSSFATRFSAAVAQAFQQAPHTFIISGMALMLAIQLISLGILALQGKSYFEELFYLGTDIYKAKRHPNNTSTKKD
ncbi:glycosyltransferase family 2 protein [Desulfopila sp. IMCC35006]|uniref:glycosyltransferase family 2 protein n=1 Tax=Desulfopila sp. IMCC35006 TaxID=2569542 RepID=UPI0010AC7F68|nr:glycosyltransferase family 2 protein [Desulfopila sp. IMCC35006]TKB23966.1 glycosyltransferase family 2 protein [Desulfopila sp. IMCC35006]